MRAAIIAGAVALFLAPSCFAAAEKVDCKNAQTQMDLDFCAGKDFHAADAKLNKVYRTLLKKYGAGDQSLLKTAEQAWLGYRDAECSYETNDTTGGTINSMEYTLCRTEKTNARVKELELQLNCQEGDLSCNNPNKVSRGTP